VGIIGIVEIPIMGNVLGVGAKMRSVGIIWEA
jgi:hypothetical protein